MHASVRCSSLRVGRCFANESATACGSQSNGRAASGSEHGSDARVPTVSVFESMIGGIDGHLVIGYLVIGRSPGLMSAARMFWDTCTAQRHLLVALHVVCGDYCDVDVCGGGSRSQ